MSVDRVGYQKQIKLLSWQLLGLAILFFLPISEVYAKAIDFAKMMTALKNNSGHIIRLTVAVAYIMGVWFIISAILHLKKVGQAGHGQAEGMGGPLTKLVVGLMLLYLPSTIDFGVIALWGHSAFGIEQMSYTASAADTFGAIKEGCVAAIRIVGYISFVRGFVILARSGDQGAQQGTLSKGMFHVIGGIMAINVVETIRMVGGILGIDII